MTKTPLPDTRNRSHLPFNLKEHAKHTLFCGTQVIQTRYYGNQKVRAVVLRTGKLLSSSKSWLDFRIALQPSTIELLHLYFLML